MDHPRRSLYEIAVELLRACLSEDDLAAWVAGTLDEHARSRAVIHVADCAPCREAVSALAVVDAPTGAALPVAGDGLVAGARIGRFVVARVLGRGGMGVVVAARDPLLGRDVAIKAVLRSVPTDQLAVLEARLAREAEVLAALHHPNVIAVHEAGRDGDRLFVVMDLVAGTSLRAWLALDRPAWRAALAVCLAAGRGLVALHTAGVTHRDVKPDNILVGDDGRVVIADLGLAHRDVVDPVAARLTRTGAILGTPRYMAPEQLAGESVDARSDQYGFAATTLEALRAGGDEPPASVRAVLQRGMDPAPAARYPSVAGLIRALERAAGRRRAVVAVAGAMVVAAGVAAVGVVRWGAGGDAAVRSAPAPGVVSEAAMPSGGVVAADSIAVAVGAAPAAMARVAPVRPSPSPSPSPISDQRSGSGSGSGSGSDPDPGTGAPPAKPGHRATANVAEQFMPLACGFPDDDTPADRVAVIDWGRVELREVVEAHYFDDPTPRALTLYAIAGQRRRYVIDGGEHADERLGTLVAKVGDLVALCPETEFEGWHLPAEWQPFYLTRGYAPIAAPPVLAARSPRPHMLRAVSRAVSGNRWTLPDGTEVLVHDSVTSVRADGSLDMGDWVLEVPADTHGAALLVPRSHAAWIVATFVRFEAHGDDLVPVLRAATVEPTLFTEP